MAGSEKPSDLVEILKPFFGRAAEAEERLSRLEAVLAAKKGGCDDGDDNLSLIVRELQSKLDIDNTKAEQACEREAPKDFQVHTAGNVKQASGNADLVEENSKLVAQNTLLATEKAEIFTENTKLEAENAKLKYRITHLIRALKEADFKLEPK